jgi:hypothetical protein
MTTATTSKGINGFIKLSSHPTSTLVVHTKKPRITTQSLSFQHHLPLKYVQTKQQPLCKTGKKQSTIHMRRPEPRENKRARPKRSGYKASQACISDGEEVESGQIRLIVPQNQAHPPSRRKVGRV